MQRYFLRNASDEQMNWIDPGLQRYTEEADVYIRVGAPDNTRAMSNIDAQRIRQQRSAQSAILHTRLERACVASFAGSGRCIRRRPARKKPI